jgi:two-component system response regulator FixJ
MNSKPHIFLIDDDDDVRSSIESMLRFLDYQVFSFSNAQSFLESEIHVCPAVVISDMRMPGMNGVELQSKLKEMGRNIPLIFISGASTIPQTITAVKQGAIEFLIKPFERQHLLSAVSRGIQIDADNMRQIIKQSNFDSALLKLSPRERQVFNLLRIGFNNTQLMERMEISLPTAKQYKSEVMRKLNLKNLAELIELSTSVQID